MVLDGLDKLGEIAASHGARQKQERWMSEADYPVTDRSRVRLFAGRGSNEKAAVHAVIDSALYGVVSYVIDGQPFATPTMVWRQGEYLYWHGSAGSRMLKHLVQGAPVCLNFTHLDGFVLSRLASAHTLNYRSVMVYGRTESVDSLQERLAQLQVFLGSRFPGRWDEVKQPNLHELRSIHMVRLRIEEASLKRRAGPAGLLVQRLKAEVDTPAYVSGFARQMQLLTPDERVGPPAPLRVRVAEVQTMATDVRRLRLQAIGPDVLPAIEPGAHARVGVVLRDGTRDVRPYTVVQSDAAGGWFDIAVLKEREGRGGSLHLHEAVRLGDELAVESFPNEFPVHEGTASAVLVAGGIGVTPIVAIARALKERGTPFDVHYSARGRHCAAYLDELQAIAGDRLRFHDTSLAANGRLDPMAVVGEPAPGRHVYVCGSASLIDAVVDAARSRGYAHDSVHHELFNPPPPLSTDKPIRLHLKRSERQVLVEPGTSLLDAALAQGVPVPHSCKRGECGECAVRVLSGGIQHRDRFLTPAQREGGLACICVAWSDDEAIELDI
jgi:ferredoxin-NADP reductase/nitroimidazol reductase NimA-like FMN-containing flavoprotein (pyridoxamine 5'-phosphate oxidase superfamily)